MGCMNPGRYPFKFYCIRGGQEHQVRSFPVGLKVLGSMSSHIDCVSNLEPMSHLRGPRSIGRCKLCTDFFLHHLESLQPSIQVTVTMTGRF